MKKLFKTQLAGLFLLTASFLSCQDHDIPQAVQIFKVGEEPAGLNYPDLHRDEIKFVFAKPPEDGPATDEDGSRHSIDKQPRPDVVILVGTYGGKGKAERSLVIPKDRYVYANILSTLYYYYDDDPCDPDFHPAPGQSPLDFLKKDFYDLKTNSTESVVLNGQELVNNANRDSFYATTEVFPFNPHKYYDYPDCDYSAKTAKAYGEGYGVLMKLPPGNHTLLVKAINTPTDGSDTFETEVLWHLTVQ